MNSTLRSSDGIYRSTTNPEATTGVPNESLSIEDLMRDYEPSEIGFPEEDEDEPFNEDNYSEESRP